MEHIIHNLSELETFARELASSMRAGEVYGISGDLGAGKTTLIQLIGRAFGVVEPMTSPTFVFRKEYVVGREAAGHRAQGNLRKLIHIDAYRIERGNAEDLGDVQEPDAITLIEWPERIEKILPPGTKRISIEILPDESRMITSEDVT